MLIYSSLNNCFKAILHLITLDLEDLKHELNRVYTVKRSDILNLSNFYPILYGSKKE
jgi:hypothetical protein